MRNCIYPVTIGQIDNGPGLESGKSDSQSRDMVGGSGEATHTTDKFVPGLAIRLSNITAEGTCLAGIAGIYENYRNSCEPGFVFQESTKLVESPITQCGALAASGLNP